MKHVSGVGVLLAAALGLLGGLGAFTFQFAEATSYLSNDPRACANCHVMREQYDGWQKGSHHAVATCNDCHVPQDLLGKYWTKAEHGWRHSKGFTLQNFREPIRITPASLAVTRANCVRCHRELVDEIDGAHAAHGTPEECVRCHSHVGHGPVK
jgi:cytochrome c nitrite reductase small subunit